MAFAPLVALMGGTVTAATVLGSMAAIGTTMTVVGAVTGSKDLMKIGGVMGLIGGVGSLVSSAGSAAGAAGAVDATGGLETAVGGSVPGQIASDAATQAGMAGAESSWDFNMGETAGIPADTLPANQLGDFGQTFTDNPAAPGSPITPQVNPAGTPINGASNATLPTQSTIGAPSGPSAVSSPSAPSSGTIATAGQADANTITASMNSKGPVGFTDYFDKFIKYAQQNKDVFNTVAQLGGGMLKGMNERDMWDEKMGLEKQRLAQTSYGNQVANYAKPLGFAGAAQRGA